MCVLSDSPCDTHVVCSPDVKIDLRNCVCLYSTRLRCLAYKSLPLVWLVVGDDVFFCSRCCTSFFRCAAAKIYDPVPCSRAKFFSKLHYRQRNRKIFRTFKSINAYKLYSTLLVSSSSQLYDLFSE